MSTVETAVGRFVWHEQVSDDPDRARAFYTQLLRWDVEVYKPGEVDYTMISSGGTVHGAFARAQEGAPPPHWLSHVAVDDADAAAERAKSAGGRVAAGPFDMGEFGRMAILGDPQGGFVSAYQLGPSGQTPEGVFVWDELLTSDADAAQRFYETVFGWTTNDMEPEYGGYRIFNRGEAGVAGLMQARDASVPTRWQPYVGVDDADAAVARAGELGGGTLLEPMDVPNVGRIAVLRDPQGAAFGVMRPQPGM